MKPIYLLFAAATLALASCARGGQEEGAALKYVQDIISGQESAAHAIVSGYGSAPKAGAVYVAGPYAPCVKAMKGLIRFEAFDNVTGHPIPDALPDFAGEKICALYDMAPEASTQEELRAAAVKSVMEAMDSVCFVSPYDNEGLGAKPVAKVVLLPSPYAAYGISDIDTLLTVFGAKLQVISPLKNALEPFFKARHSAATVAVLAAKEYALGNAYKGYVDYLSAKQGLDSSTCVVSADSSAAPFLNLLAAYAENGNKKPIDILIVDNPDIDIRTVYENILRVRSVMYPESLVYGNLLAKDFRVVDLARKGAEECFKALRLGNLFTHKVAWPESMEYMSAEGKILQYDTKYLEK